MKYIFCLLIVVSQFVLTLGNVIYLHDNKKLEFKQLYCINSKACSGKLPNFVECRKEHSSWTWTCKSDSHNIKVINVICDWNNGKYIENTCKLYYTLEESNYLKYFGYFLIICSFVVLGFAVYKLQLQNRKYLKEKTLNGKVSEKVSFFGNDLHYHGINIV